jgi:hypothetical protein
MHTMPDEITRKALLIAVFFAGFLTALIWLLGDVAKWVFAVLKATGH